MAKPSEGRGCTDKEINTYFSSLDNDKSGSLDVTEVGRSLLGLKEAIGRKAYAEGLGRVVGLRKVDAMLEAAAVLVVAAGSVPAPQQASVSARLGKLLDDKNVKVDSLYSS